MVKPDTTTPSRTSAQLVRQGVRDLLASTASYNVLPADRRRKIAKDTVRVAAYMVDPQGLLTAEFRSPLLAGVVLSETGRRSAGFGKPVLDAIQMSPRSMDNLLAAVDFPSFVADLIQGVFGASLRRADHGRVTVGGPICPGEHHRRFSATCAGERVPECRLLGRRRHAAPEAPRACPLAEPVDAGRRHRTA